MKIALNVSKDLSLQNIAQFQFIQHWADEIEYLEVKGRAAFNVVESDSKRVLLLDQKKFEKGVSLTVRKHPWRIQRIMSGNPTAEDASIIIQFAIFGQQMYD